MILGMPARRLAPAGLTDPFFSSVRSLLHFDGSNGASSTSDQKANIWTLRNGAQLSSSQARFGPTSLILNGSSSYMTADDPDTEDLNIGGGESFSIEAWIYLNVNNKLQYIFNRGTSPTTAFGLGFAVSSSGKLLAARQYVAFIATGSTTIPTGQWVHVCACRDGFPNNELRLFVNGALDATFIDSDSFIVSGNTRSQIGAQEENALSYNHLDGYIDDFRLTIGVARYVSSFTPPVEAFPDA